MEEVFYSCKFYQYNKNINKMILKPNQTSYNRIIKICLRKNTLLLRWDITGDVTLG